MVVAEMGKQAALARPAAMMSARVLAVSASEKASRKSLMDRCLSSVGVAPITSGTEVAAYAMTGQPQAWASMRGRPKPSLSDGYKRQWAEV